MFKCFKIIKTKCQNLNIADRRKLIVESFVMIFGSVSILYAVLSKNSPKLAFLFAIIYGNIVWTLRIIQIHIGVKITLFELRQLNKLIKETRKAEKFSFVNRYDLLEKLKTDYEDLQKFAKMLNECTAWSLFGCYINFGLLFMNCFYFSLLSLVKGYNFIYGNRKFFFVFFLQLMKSKNILF